MLRSGRLDNGAEHLDTAHFESDRDDLDTLAVDLAAQCLPPGQVEAAASIRCPGGEHHLLPAERRQGDVVAGEHIGQAQLGCFGGGE